jgi:hypothetical protein
MFVHRQQGSSPEVRWQAAADRHRARYSHAWPARRVRASETRWSHRRPPAGQALRPPLPGSRRPQAGSQIENQCRLANNLGRAPRARKSDSDHTGTVGITPGAGPTPTERHETQDPLRSNALEVRFHSVRNRASPHDQLRLSGSGPRGGCALVGTGMIKVLANRKSLTASDGCRILCNFIGCCGHSCAGWRRRSISVRCGPMADRRLLKLN